MEVNPQIFREYDIRGKVAQDLTANFAEILGRACGTYFQEHGCREVAVGRDCRLSSPELAAWLIRGLLSTGCNVEDIGVVPTPVLYFNVFKRKKEAAIMITGSHNPPDQNGFKIMLGEETLYGPRIQELYRLVKEERFVQNKPGEVIQYDVIPEYIDFIINNIKLKKPLKIVLDAGNGTAGVVAGPIFKKLGCEVIELYCEMDGRFPHHHPDPTLPEALKELIDKVLMTGADFGVGYDGDGDRLGVVDDKGKIIWGDQLLILYAKDLLPKNPGAAIISEVKASKVLYSEIERLGGRPIMWKTGHSLIKKKLREEGALLAGEMSGHIFFADRYFGFDDAIYASCRLAEIVAQSDQKLSSLLAYLPPTYYTPEIRLYASDEVKFKIVDELKKELSPLYPLIDLDGVRVIFPQGWALVRASNTQAVLVLRFEADTPEALEKIQQEIKSKLEAVIRRLGDKEK
ncbi:MAG: phosphomannomutase/phosphoglucomutase [Candidatus Aminicenantes bacterium]|nr:phosphomannomutase/phosphoglucomutase [Candidatus Aminicenantes bacterium]